MGYERIQEIENPELAQDRMKQLYEQKGYPKDWIDKRLRGIAIRQNLTDEWKERGISVERDFSVLTAEIAKATFGITLSEHTGSGDSLFNSCQLSPARPRLHPTRLTLCSI